MAKKSTKELNNPKIPIGWQEYCHLPELGLSQIKAKMDTGAKTSALHATHLKPILKDGVDFIRFRVGTKTCEAPLIEMRHVKNSGGKQEKRYVIKTAIAMGPFKWDIEITLTNRRTMRFLLLLGRQALRGRFMIDSHKRYLLGKL